MEETLGKRIAYHRKRLGMTQDKLAELLGVTAQAVSKWENDQSCPDINLLPKLAELFGITTDELLGVKKEETVHTGEIVTDEAKNSESEDTFTADGKIGFHFEVEKKGSLWLALWVLLTAVLMLVYPLWMTEPISLWDVLWPSGLLLLGLSGLYPDFSVFRLGCALFGGYFLLTNLNIIPHLLTTAYLLPFFLLLFGLSLLIDALRKPKKKSFTIHRNGKAVRRNNCTLDGDGFHCEGCFGEGEHLIQLPRLSSGTADLSFGSMTIDLSGCDEIAEDCQLDLNCSFGELTLLVPRRFRAVPQPSAAFGNVEVKGSPAPDAQAVIHAKCGVSFGQILLRYI